LFTAKERQGKLGNLDKQDGAALATTGAAAERTGVSVERISYHGWPECFLLSNGCVEAVIVPAIGRVMHFGMAGEPESVFWQNRELYGQLPATDSDKWSNFGGDKCWPAPQSEWLERTGRDWPVPRTFDSGPAEAAAIDQGVVLTSRMDPAYGIQVIRTIQLEPAQSVMRIATEYHKLQGPAVTVGIWTITQLRDPERILLWQPAVSRFPRGYLSFLKTEPAELSRRGRLLSLKRNQIIFTKIGSDAASMAWVGKSCVLRIDAEVGPGEYPDGGCVTEVYTNPDPMRYVELETLGPLETIGIGSRIGRTTVYTLMPRRSQDEESEADFVFI
jgi:hypothetical protein